MLLQKVLQLKNEVWGSQNSTHPRQDGGLLRHMSILGVAASLCPIDRLRPYTITGVPREYLDRIGRTSDVPLGPQASGGLVS